MGLKNWKRILEKHNDDDFVLLLQAVQQVVTNLQIGHIELRNEDSFDIQRYVHERKVEFPTGCRSRPSPPDPLMGRYLQQASPLQ
jgi:hypothetical protein